ncbi:MAG: O-methyltransferase [Bacteroidales bacterium]
MTDIDSDLFGYIIGHTTPEDKVLAELNRETFAKILYPRMISGHYQGRFLEFISRMVQPDCILEIGTFTGYSAICLAKGLRPGGMLHTIECNDEIVDFAQNYINKSGLGDKIQIHTGDALEVIPALNMQFDMVFIDAEKKYYPDYFRLVAEKLKTGGMLLADNVLWNGKVIGNEPKPDDETNNILMFNKLVHEDNRFENMIIPIRDGIMLALKVCS